jgi:hypothetical protein
MLIAFILFAAPELRIPQPAIVFVFKPIAPAFINTEFFPAT